MSLLLQQPSQMLKPGAPGGNEVSADAEVPAQQNVEGMQYDEAGTYMILEFELTRPIVPKRAPEELAKK